MENGYPKTTADRQALVLSELNQKQVLHIGDLRGHIAGEVVSLRPVFAQVVEFPIVLVGRPFLDAWGQASDPWYSRTKGRCDPPVVINGPASHDFKILSMFHFRGFRIIEGLAKLTPSN